MADVANYTIENNSGANVRIDLNSVFAALQSLNSKTTDLAASQCVAGMPFLNSTTNILKIRNSANNGFTDIGNINVANLGLLPAAGGVMTGALLGHDGSDASAPAFSFDTDTDLGLFRKQANIMGFSSAGTEQMVFDANGITLREQNEIRFGDNNSSHYIGLRSAATIASSFTLNLPTADGSNGQFLTTDGSGNLSFATAPVTTLANLSASNLTSGTIPTARFPSTLPAVSGASLTGIIGSAKAFVNINGLGTLSVRDSFGISSVTDLGQGRYQPNFSSGVVSGSDYSVTHSISQDQAGHGSHGCLYVMTKSSSNFATRICKDEGSGLTMDKEFCDFAVFQN